MMATAVVALVGAGPAGAATHTYVAAPCAALLDGAGAPIAAPQDITVNVSAPATAESGDTVTISFPGVTNSLPAVNIVPTHDDVQDHRQHLRRGHRDPQR